MILNGYGDFFTFQQFVTFLKQLAEQMYKYTNTITNTDKFKRFLSKLNLDDPLQVQQSLFKMEQGSAPTNNSFVIQQLEGGENYFKDPKLPFLKGVKQEVRDYGEIYDKEDYEGSTKLPKLIYRNYNRAKKGQAVKRHEDFIEKRNSK